MATANILRIKAAQEQLVAACGGADQCVELLHNHGRSTIYRWADKNDPTLMPLAAVIAMEAHCGLALVTAALAELNGRSLTVRPAEPAPGTIMTRHAEAIIHAGELMAAGAAAFSDGKLTPNEASTIDRAAGQLELALSEYRKALAGARAVGGLSVVSGGAA